MKPESRLFVFAAAYLAAVLILASTARAVDENPAERAILPIVQQRGFTAEDLRIPEFKPMPEPSAEKEGTTYHVDAQKGSDETGDGSEAKPFKTIKHLWPRLEGGDTVLVHDGLYGTIRHKPWGDRPFAGAGSLFDDWVTITPAPGASPKIQSVRIYQRAKKGDPKPDCHLKLENLRFLDGVHVRGANKFALLDSHVECEGRLNGPVENLGKVGVKLAGVGDALVRDNEITHVGVGIALNGCDRISVLDNHVHDGSHDGMHVVGVQHSLIAGNRIHGFDDGLWDEEAKKLAKQGKPAGNRHCDGIHIFIHGGPCDKLRPNSYVMFRGNVLYDFESQGVQINNYIRCRDVWNNHLYFENNIFGPTHANTVNAADPVDGFVFRHNTFVRVEGRVYESRYRSIPQDNSTFRVSDNYENVAIYNNILPRGRAMDDGHIVNDWNLVWDKRNLPSLGRHSIVAPDLEFTDPEQFDGRLPADTPAVDAGTRLFATAPLNPDKYRTPRDARPDMGAYEVPERSPAPETPLPAPPENPTVFVDNFADSNLARDLFLNGQDRQGLSWRQGPNEKARFGVGRGGRLDSPHLEGRYVVFSRQGRNWRSYRFEFDAHNAYQTMGAGPLLLVQNQDNHYFLDIGKSSGKLIRSIDSEETVLAEKPALRLPHNGEKPYAITVTVSDEAVEIAVDAGRDGSTDLTHRDTDPDALKTFRSGGIGFLRDYPRKWHRVAYDDIRVTILEFTDN